MGSRAKIKVEILKETVVEGDDFELGDILVLEKESYKGVSVYKVYSGAYYDEDFSELEEVFATHSKESADRIFSMLESTYPESSLTRKIF